MRDDARSESPVDPAGDPPEGGVAGGPGAAPGHDHDRWERRVRRVAGLLAGGAALGLLAVAAWLSPDPAGSGTHRQLSLPECGWMTAFDTPCPTCGMTTAFAHAAEGDLLGSVVAQPLGALLALITAMTAAGGLYVAATGSRLAAALTRLWGPRTGWITGGLVLGSWMWKIASHRGWV